MMDIPKTGRGRKSARQQAIYDEQLDVFYKELMEINSSIDFSVSSRGWCYFLEDHGLLKGDFDTAENLINDGRKNGKLPTDICGVDESRALRDIEIVDATEPQEEAKYIIDDVVEHYINNYLPESQWENQDYFIAMAVEKKDLLGVFNPVCKKYGIPITNFKGWTDLN